MSAVSHWVFTYNNPDGNIDVDLNQLLDAGTIRYATWQLEISASGTQHLQGYLEFTRSRRLAFCKSILEEAHFEPRRGSRAQARDYARKDDSRLEGPWEVGVWKPDLRPGTRTDIAEFRDAVLAGKHDLDLASLYPREFCMYLKAVDRLRAHITPHRSTVTELHLCFGDPGLGKTTWVNTAEPAAYWKEHSEWWDGYDGQESVVADEFYGFLPFNFLLRLADGSPLRVQIKGGFSVFRAKRLYLISNKHPHDWYPTAKAKFNWEAFYRRVTKVRHWLAIGEFREFDSWQAYESFIGLSSLSSYSYE